MTLRTRLRMRLLVMNDPRNQRGSCLNWLLTAIAIACIAGAALYLHFARRLPRSLPSLVSAIAPATAPAPTPACRRSATSLSSTHLISWVARVKEMVGTAFSTNSRTVYAKHHIPRSPSRPFKPSHGLEAVNASGETGQVVLGRARSRRPL